MSELTLEIPPEIDKHLLPFLTVSYGVPEEVQLDLIEQYDDVDERNGLLLSVIISTYLMHHLNLSVDEANDYFKTISQEDLYEIFPKMITSGVFLYIIDHGSLLPNSKKDNH